MSNFSTVIFIEFTSVLDVDIDPKQLRKFLFARLIHHIQVLFHRFTTPPFRQIVLHLRAMDI